MIIREIISDLKAEIDKSRIAWKFHMWVSDSIISVLRHLDFEKIVLSGGCFQNILLTRMVTEALKENNYEYYLNRIVPPNDGGIALGQAYY